MSTVTVAITNWNYGVFLGDAVRSIIAQTRPADDWYIVDDGSTDHESLELYSVFNDRVIKHGNQRGTAAACNTALERCKTDFLINLDADDFMAQNYLGMMLDTAEKENADWVYCDSQLVDELGHDLTRMNYPAFDSEKLMVQNFINQSAMIRAEISRKVGGHRPCADALNDWDIWKRIASTGVKAVKCPDTILFYRHHGFSRMHGGRGIG